MRPVTNPTQTRTRVSAVSIAVVLTMGLLTGCKAHSDATTTETSATSATSASSSSSATSATTAQSTASMTDAAETESATATSASDAATTTASVPADASPESAEIMTAWNDLGYCGTAWTSDLEAAKGETYGEAPIPQESWSCASATQTVGLTRWKDGAEAKAFFAALVTEAKSAGTDLSDYTVLSLDSGIVIGAVDITARSTDTKALEEIKAKVGGNIVTYAEVGGLA